MNTGNNLETKIWFRAVKVLYIFLYLLALLLVIISALNNRPRTTIYKNKYKIVCKNNNIYYSDEIKDISEYGILCKYGRMPQGQLIDVPKDNFVQIYEKDIILYWTPVIKTFLIGLFVIWIIFRIIKVIFTYVLIGKWELKSFF
jgi:hypothetical protein